MLYWTSSTWLSIDSHDEVTVEMDDVASYSIYNSVS
jgi:hypothetical protein